MWRYPCAEAPVTCRATATVTAMSTPRSVMCTACGQALGDLAGQSLEERTPCPRCGSEARTISVAVSGTLTGEGTLTAGGPPSAASSKLSTRADADGARDSDTGVGSTQLGLEVLRSCKVNFAHVHGDVVAVEVINDQGKVLASGLGDNNVDALLDIIAYLLPVDHPEFPTA